MLHMHAFTKQNEAKSKIFKQKSIIFDCKTQI